MSIRIVTDSNCDLPTNIVEEYAITVVPMYINIGTESYLDGVDQARLAQAHEPAGVAPQHLALAHRELAQNIGAALALGDMDLMGADLDWLKGLLGDRGQ